MNILKLIVVEYSVTQNAFHSESVKEMLENNIGNASRGLSTDYQVIGVFETENEAGEYLQLAKTKFRKEPS